MFCQWFNPLEHLSAILEINSHPVHGLIDESKKVLFFFKQQLCQWFNPLEQQHSAKVKLKSGIW